MDGTTRSIVTPRIDALRAVLREDPESHEIRRMLAEALVGEGEDSAAVDEYLVLRQAGVLGDEEARAAVDLALQLERLDDARTLLGVSPESSPPETRPTNPQADNSVGLSSPERTGPVDVQGTDFIDSIFGTITFADVGGLRDVKKAVDRLVIQPLRNPDLFAKYGKHAGGGVLLYGPPGCGKTMMARAIAGEAQLPIYNLRIEDIVDPYFGVSEQRLAGAFDAARELSPCVLFIDELDAMGYARSQQNSERGRALVEILLQQLDSVGNDNTGILVLAASNEPWDIDGALLRPGRFDRTLFVPPPDQEARIAILESALADVPQQDLRLKPVADSTELCSGADLRGLIDRSLEEVLDEALTSGGEPPLRQAHLVTAVQETRPTTVTWLARARNHVDFGNVGGRWDEIKRYLKQRHVAKILRAQDQS